MFMPPRVCILCHAYHPWWGGAEIAVREIVRRLSPRWEFSLLTARLQESPARETVEGLPVRRIGPPGTVGKYAYSLLAPRVFRETMAEKTDIVWAVLESHAGIAGWRVKNSFPHIPYVLTLQSGDSEAFWKLRTAWWRPWYKNVFTAPDHIQAISSYLADRARAYGYEGDISLIPNGVDVDIFSPHSVKATKESIRRREGIPENATVIVSTSRLVHKNGIDILIQSLAHLPPSFVLALVGEGKDEKLLRRLAVRAQVQKRVFFLGGKPHRQLPEFLFFADVFARPARSEGLGNSFLEAMAMRIPVVGTEVGGIPDFLKQRETGMVCRTEDPKSCASAIEEIARDPSLREKVVSRAEQVVRDRYTWNAVADQMDSLFTGLLRAKKEKTTV